MKARYVHEIIPVHYHLSPPNYFLIIFFGFSLKSNKKLCLLFMEGRLSYNADSCP